MNKKMLVRQLKKNL